jgi:sporulation protein YlmC with PRC-barrel domain
VDLVRDVLDKQVLNRHGREIGRVDSIILELRPGAPPRVNRIEIGPAVLAARIHPVLGRWVRGIEYALGTADQRPVKVPFGGILDVSDRVKVDLP